MRPQRYITDQAESNSPFLLFVSIATPHFPHHSAPEEYKALYPESDIQIAPNVPENLHINVRKELNGYYAHCTATDKAIGDLIAKIKELDLMKKTIVVFTSDHGEMMGAHGCRPFAKQFAWNESVRIPFLIKYPDMGNKPVTVNTPITTPDILPTLLGLANIKIPDSIEGEDLSGVMISSGKEIDRAALFMNVCPFTQEYTVDEYRGIITDQYSYVCTPEGASMLYDIRKDPYQMYNLLGKDGFESIQQALDGKLRAALNKIGDEDFRNRNYYLKKWNLVLNSKDNTYVDYGGFLKGTGVIQSPGN